MIYNIGFLEMKYLVSLSKDTALNASLPSTITFKLNRQIPSGSKVKLLQFNFNTGPYGGSTNPLNTNAISVVNNGILICIDNLMTTNSFTNDSSSTQTHPILSSIPQSTFFTSDSDVVGSYSMDKVTRYRQNTYEPQYACSLDISSPISVFEISLRANNDAALLDSTQLEKLSVNFLLEIEEDCDCKKNDY